MIVRDLATLADSWNPERRAFTVAETEAYWIDVVPMIYNYRLVMTPKSAPGGYDFGWCYANMTDALLALFRWDPERDAEPSDYVKRATPVLRTTKDV